jgi:hypothetical protein
MGSSLRKEVDMLRDNISNAGWQLEGRGLVRLLDLLQRMAYHIDTAETARRTDGGSR